MIYINKMHTAPSGYHDWYKKYSKKSWEKVSSNTKKILRNILLEEQGYVCCF